MEEIKTCSNCLFEVCADYDSPCSDCKMTARNDTERSRRLFLWSPAIKSGFEHDACQGCKHDSKTAVELPCSHCRGTILPSDPFYEKCADLYEPEEPKNPYWERICKLSEKQRAKGMETYGQGIESNPAPIMERINHLQEEMVDALMYCEWLKDKFAELEDEE